MTFLRRGKLKLGKFNVATMSIDELWSLHEEVIETLSAKIESAKRSLDERLSELTHHSIDRGASVKSTIGERRATKRRYPPVVPKFRNPSDPKETWAGRGKQPRWVVAQLKAGRKMDDFLIGRGKHQSTRKRRQA
jgi:DNA-binding protein H-NS